MAEYFSFFSFLFCFVSLARRVALVFTRKLAAIELRMSIPIFRVFVSKSIDMNVIAKRWHMSLASINGQMCASRLSSLFSSSMMGEGVLKCDKYGRHVSICLAYPSYAVIVGALMLFLAMSWNFGDFSELLALSGFCLVMIFIRLLIDIKFLIALKRSIEA